MLATGFLLGIFLRRRDGGSLKGYDACLLGSSLD